MIISTFTNSWHYEVQENILASVTILWEETPPPNIKSDRFDERFLIPSGQDE